MKLTDRVEEPVYGFVANGQKGPAVAQDWMQYNAQMGGSILGARRQAGAELRRQRKSLTSTRSCSTRPRRPGAPTTTGAAARRASARGSPPTCRPGRSAPPATTIRRNRRSSARPASCWRPPGEGLKKTYGVGGWGLAINADIDDEAAGSGVGLHQVDHQPGGPQGDEHARRRQLSPHQRDA